MGQVGSRYVAMAPVVGDPVSFQRYAAIRRGELLSVIVEHPVEIHVPAHLSMSVWRHGIWSRLPTDDELREAVMLLLTDGDWFEENEATSHRARHAWAGRKGGV